MSKEELHDRGWDLFYSGPTGVASWGKHMVHLRHTNGRMMHGYGADEQTALVNAAESINKPLDDYKNEVHH